MSHGWRISPITHHHSTPRPTGLGCLSSAFGVLMFLGGVIAAIVWNPWAVLIAVGGWVLIMLTIWLTARGRRRNWRRVRARCLDRELRQVSNPKGGRSWMWRLLCEYDLPQGAQRVTPAVQWCTFLFRSSAERYLSQRVAEDGSCELYVNPDDPREAELVGQGIKEWLLIPGHLRRAVD